MQDYSSRPALCNVGYARPRLCPVGSRGESQGSRRWVCRVPVGFLGSWVSWSVGWAMNDICRFWLGLFGEFW